MRHGGVGVLDVLRLVEDHRAQPGLAPVRRVTAQQRVVGDHEVEALATSARSAVTLAAALQHEHAQRSAQALGLAPPVMHHGRRAHDQRRAAVKDRGGADARATRASAPNLAEAHVVGEGTATSEVAGERQEVEAAALVRRSFAFSVRGGGRAAARERRRHALAELVHRAQRLRVRTDTRERVEARRSARRRAATASSALATAADLDAEGPRERARPRQAGPPACAPIRDGSRTKRVVAVRSVAISSSPAASVRHAAD